MKIIKLSIILFLLNPFLNVLAIENQNFYISCTAKGTAEMTYNNRITNELLIDEYKIIIGKVDFAERFPISLELVNTNANRENDFYLYRNKNQNIQSYKDRIIISQNYWSGTTFKSSYSISISLISGKYIFSYKDEPFDGSNDILYFSSIGKCEGLNKILNYLESSTNNKSNSGLKELLKKIY